MRYSSIILVGIVMLSFLALGSAYIMIVPLWESPDEPSNFSAAQAVARVHRVPTLFEQPLYPGVLMNFKKHPPAYFAFAGLLLSINPDIRPEFVANERGFVSSEIAHYRHGGGIPADQFSGAAFLRLLRGASLLFGAFTLILIWRCARLLWPQDRMPAFMAICFGLTPTFIFSHAAIDPLPLGILVASLIIYQLLWIYEQGRVELRRWKWLALLLVLGLATRATLVFLYLPAIWLIRREPRGGRMRLVGQLATPLVLGTIWMLVLAPGPMLISFRQLGSQLVHLNRAYLSFGGLRTIILHSKNSLWARFGWADLYPPARLLDVLDVLALLATVGLVIRIWKRTVRPGARMLLVVGGLGFLGFLRANLAQPDPQGRFLQLVVAAYAPLAGLGLAWFLQRTGKRWIPLAAGTVLLLLLIGINVYCLAFVIHPAYAAEEYPEMELAAYQEQGVMLWGGVSSGQTFICREPGLCRIEFYVTPVELREAAVLEFRLSQSSLLSEPFVVARVPYPGAGDSPYVGFRFSPMWDSKDRCYFVQVTRIPLREPISTWYTLEDRYLGGTRYADGAPAPGDLRFTTYVALPPVPSE